MAGGAAPALRGPRLQKAETQKTIKESVGAGSEQTWATVLTKTGVGSKDSEQTDATKMGFESEVNLDRIKISKASKMRLLTAPAS